MNPNEYNDDKFREASLKLQDAVVELWGAGAEEEDIRGECEHAIGNARRN